MADGLRPCEFISKNTKKLKSLMNRLLKYAKVAVTYGTCFWTQISRSFFYLNQIWEKNPDWNISPCPYPLPHLSYDSHYSMYIPHVHFMPPFNLKSQKILPIPWSRGKYFYVAENRTWNLPDFWQDIERGRVPSFSVLSLFMVLSFTYSIRRMQSCYYEI